MAMLAPSCETIERKIALGLIPGVWPVVAEAHWGVGWPCVACEAPIHADAIEVRTLFPDDDPADFHLHCFVLWAHAIAALDTDATHADS